MEVRVLGLMSGSSLDGIDVADCTFKINPEKVKFEINTALTLAYPKELQGALLEAAQISSKDLKLLDIEYSEWIADKLEQFIKGRSEISLIGIHGHTVFHKPNEGFSLQLGDGRIIHSIVGVPLVTDFRNADIKAGGQGAPLSPKGDLDLFPDYKGFLNLGGISNFSVKTKEQSIIGFDICPFNLALNELAQKKGYEYDKDGNLASQGSVIVPLLEELNAIEYYKSIKPKSIDRVWYENTFQPIIKRFYNDYKLEDIIHTVNNHQAIQISAVLNQYLNKEEKVLISGGGAHNGFFTELLKSKIKSNLIIPDASIADNKEAIIFAYLALLKALGMPNCIAQVTGAKRDSIGGMLFGNCNFNKN
ncbi:anhydro-N-acetylmuramic acid kinase [Hyphobacterium sp. CCMP332]|nr:anhydro-N-acetylmuramic acid kinase [Hyphobacterium sp. CCMP332]